MKTITICYRKIIDVNCTKPWEKLIFEDSYREFKIQSQVYNQDKKYHTFSELLYNVPHADQLHYLVSGAIISYLRQLNDVVPDIVNNIGKHFLNFKQFKFEIINSDLNDIEKHSVAISFYSEPILWHDTVGNYLLTSPVINTGESISTDMFTIQPFLTINSILL